MAIIKTTKDNKYWWRYGEKRALVHWWWKCKSVYPSWKTVWRFRKELKIELPYDPAIPLLGIYPKKMKSVSWRGICTPMFTAALFTVPRTWKQSKRPSMDEQIKKTWCIHTMEYYSGLKKKKILTLQEHGWTWKTLSKWNKWRRILHDLAYRWNLKYLNSQNPRVEQWLSGVGWRGKWGDVG